MKINQNSNIPIFIQVKTEIENMILTKQYLENNQIPSTTELSVSLKINPHTILKGMNLLVDEKILYKKRGIGIFVESGAIDKIKSNRKEQLLEDKINNLVMEAKLLNISKEELKNAIERNYYDKDK